MHSINLYIKTAEPADRIQKEEIKMYRMNSPNLISAFEIWWLISWNNTASCQLKYQFTEKLDTFSL